MRKSVIAAALALGFGVANASPGNLVFDPTGLDAGGSFVIDQLDWSPSGVLSVDGNQAIANFLNGSGSTTFTVLSHATLAGGLLGGAGVFSTTGSPYEITAVVGFQEQVIAATLGNGVTTSGTADFAFVAGAPNFVRLYYGASGASANNNLVHGGGFGDAAATKNADMLLGTGFNDGHLIFDSTVTTVGGSFSVTISPGVGDLDQSGNGDQWTSPYAPAGQQSVSGFGSNSTVTVDLAPTWFDPDFFNNPPILQFLLENLSLNVPFTTTDPSRNFTQADNTLYNVTATDGTGAVSTLGPTNGGLSGCTPVPGGFTGCTPDGPDFLFSTDINSAVRGTIPEPGTLALAGLALAAIGGLARRRKFF